MQAGESVDQNTWGSSGPYHGSEEGYGRAFFWLALLEGVMALALPWLDIRIVAHGAKGGHLVWLAITTNILCATAMLTFLQVYQGLGRQIARGGPEAVHLDKIRMRVAVMTGSLLFAGLVLHMCGAWATR